MAKKGIEIKLQHGLVALSAEPNGRDGVRFIILGPTPRPGGFRPTLAYGDAWAPSYRCVVVKGLVDVAQLDLVTLGLRAAGDAARLRARPH